MKAYIGNDRPVKSHLHAHLDTYKHMQTYIKTCKHSETNKQTNTFTCKHTQVYVATHTCNNTYKHRQIHMYKHTQTHANTCKHAHTSNQTCKQTARLTLQPKEALTAFWERPSWWKRCPKEVRREWRGRSSLRAMQLRTQVRSTPFACERGQKQICTNTS